MAFEIAREILLGHLEHGHGLDRWIHGLSRTETGQRLAICLAIDLQTGAISARDIDPIVTSLPDATTDVVSHFSTTLDRHPDKERLREGKSLTVEALPDHDFYVRVLQITSYVTHYLKSFEYSLDLTDLNEVQDVFFSKSLFDPAGGSQVSYVKDYWKGRNDTVWVTRFSELQRAAGSGGPHSGAAVNDALGLGFPVAGDNIPVLVAVRYPAEFGVPCLKPTTFVADWTTSAGYYLSDASRSGWGKTQSCTGQIEGVHERVHESFPGLSKEFAAYYIGPVSSFVASFANFLVESTSRLHASMNGSR